MPMAFDLFKNDTPLCRVLSSFEPARAGGSLVYRLLPYPHQATASPLENRHPIQKCWLKTTVAASRTQQGYLETW